MRTLVSYVVIAATLLLPLPAGAQFVTPIPRPLTGPDVKRDIVYRALQDAAVDLWIEHRGAEDSLADRLKAVRDRQCRAVYGPRQRAPASEASPAEIACSQSVDDDEINAIASAIDGIQPTEQEAERLAARTEGQSVELSEQTRTRLTDAVPSLLNYPGLFPRRRADLIPYFRATNFESLSIFRQFSAQIKEDHAFVLTESISGSIGFLLFGLTYAAVAVKGDPKEITVGQDEVIVDVAADTVSTVTAQVTRLVNNGGTISGRFQYPILAGGGTNVQHAASIYSQLGALGPASMTDSLKFSGAVVLEYLAGLTLRSFDESDDVAGELVLGFRLGWAGSESSIAPQLAAGPDPVDAKSTWFMQLGVGVAEIGGTGFKFSALLTPPWIFRDELEAFMPRAVINLAMLR